MSTLIKTSYLSMSFLDTIGYYIIYESLLLLIQRILYGIIYNVDIINIVIFKNDILLE